METFLASVISLLLRLIQPFPAPTSPLPPPSPTPHPVNQINYQADTYQYFYFSVIDLSKLKLIPNFQSKQSSQTIKENYRCLELINGGFYTPESTPLGWFHSPEFQSNHHHSSNLINGYFSLSADLVPSIASTKPHESVLLGLQSGPVLLLDKLPLNLRLSNDKHSPRSIAAIDSQDRVVFIYILSSTETFSGPKLESLPQIIAQISASQNLDLISAINLDGGSASAFFNSQASFSEFKPVGSFFCLTP